MKFIPSGALKAIVTTATEHAPGILTGLGVAGMVASIVLAIAETPKAMEKIEEKKEELHVEKLTPVETVKTTWKIYIPMASTAILSGACIIGGCHINGRRNAALAAAYTLTDQAFREYQTATTETVGEKKEQEIRDNVAQNIANRDGPLITELIDTKQGTTYFYDPILKKRFTHNIDKINRAINTLNSRLRQEMFVPINEWYAELGVDGMDGYVGENIGWDVNRDGCDIDVDLSYVNWYDGVPYVVLNYSVMPRYI